MSSYRENPFPGMNPWMQSTWGDVHLSLIAYILDALSDELPDDLVARGEEDIALMIPGEKDQHYRPDVGVAEDEPWKRGERPIWAPKDDPDLANRVATPVFVEVERVTPRWVEIRSTDGRLVTVIEVTSPSNKTPNGRNDFERKLGSFLQGGVNVMEIDLVRGGLPMRAPGKTDWPESDYQIVVLRADSPNQTEIYPCSLRERLPAVRVPLRPSEPDAALDLQPLIDRCYAKRRYWKLNYEESPRPKLEPKDLTWAQERLKEVGLLES